METPPKYPTVKPHSFLEALVASPSAPWRAKSVLLALMLVLAGGVFWVRGALKSQSTAPQQTTATNNTHPRPTSGSMFNRPLPLTVRAGVSYACGFLIGWTFRRFIRVAVVLTAGVILLIGLGRYAGCDTTATEAKVKEESILVQREAKVARDYLKGLLPSASVGAVGAFLGFRRKDLTRIES